MPFRDLKIPFSRISEPCFAVARGLLEGASHGHDHLSHVRSCGSSRGPVAETGFSRLSGLVDGTGLVTFCDERDTTGNHETDWIGFVDASLG